jgi:hypothetical protein
MVDQQLLTIFIAVTTVAILIQTGITAGLFYVSLKMTRQADRAVAEARKLAGPVHDMMGKIEVAANRLAELSATSKTELHQMGFRLERVADRLHRKVG